VVLHARVTELFHYASYHGGTQPWRDEGDTRTQRSLVHTKLRLVASEVLFAYCAPLLFNFRWLGRKFDRGADEFLFYPRAVTRQRSAPLPVTLPYGYRQGRGGARGGMVDLMSPTSADLHALLTSTGACSLYPNLTVVTNFEPHVDMCARDPETLVTSNT